MATANPTERALQSVTRLRARMLETPGLLAETAALALSPIDLGRGLVTTGVGQSEGVARLVARAAQRAGHVAEFLPLSCFVGRAPAPSTRHVMLFSQGLSPNAAAALEATGAFDAATVITSRPRTDARLERLRGPRHDVCVVPPAAEDGLLVRVSGPRTAALAGLRLLGLLAPRLDEATSRAFSLGDAAALSGQPALVTEGAWVDLCGALPWTWMEALWREPPLMCDALQFVHGAYQALADGPRDVVALKPADAHQPLFRRLEALLRDTPHRLHTFTATRADVFAFFEFAAFVDGLISAALRATPVELERWPAQGTDGALYEWNGAT